MWSLRRAATTRARWTTAAACRAARWPTPSSSTRSCAPSTRETRQRFSTWLDQQGFAARGKGEAISDALGNLTPFAENTDDVLKVLRVQSGATRRLIRNTGEVFSALSERQGQLSALIRNSNRTWEAVASRDAKLADTFRVLPTFLREGRTTTTRLSEFAENTNPLIDQLRPAARQLSPALADLDKLAPDLSGLFTNFKPLVRVSKKGLPATSEALNNTRPFLGRLDTFLREFTPIVDYLGLYKREIAAFFANATGGHAGQGGRQAALPAHAEPGQPGDHGRVSEPASRTNRSNPYPARAARRTSRPNLKTFGSYLCTSNPVPEPPAANANLAQSLVDVLDYYAWGGAKNRGAAPPCTPVATRAEDERRRRAVPAPAAASVAAALRTAAPPRRTIPLPKLTA